MFEKRLSQDTVAIGAPAKINLCLKVLGRRPDGFHDIDSLFQAVSLFDRLRFTRTDQPGEVAIKLSQPSDLPLGDSNLITRSFRLMQAEFDFKGGMTVELEKNIPVAAGLGGGSADGAAAILACKLLHDLPIDSNEMGRLSAAIGSDLPFFFSNGQAHVTGRGEYVEAINLPTDYWLVLVTPDLALSTAEAYQALRMPLTKSADSSSIQGWKVPENLVKWLEDSGNDFEPGQIKANPELARIKDGLNCAGARLTRMSGSGPTVFGLFNDTPEFDGDKVYGRTNWSISTVRPIRLPTRL